MKKTLKLITTVLLTLALTLPVSSSYPSLFWNDEGWYKDAIAPMVVRDGSYYVPADFFGMFDSVTVTTPREDNLLLANAETGGYVSILTREGSAALNGVLEDNFRVLRIDASYYVEAETAAAALGLGTELWRADDGSVSLRVTDGEEMLTLSEVAEMYAEDGGADEMNPGVRLPEQGTAAGRRLCLLCTSPEDGADYVVSERLAQEGLDCTVFLWDSANNDEILSATTYGTYGVITENDEYTAEALRSSNERIGRLTHRRTCLTLTTYDDALDRKLADAGYYPLRPDFTVTDMTDLEQFYEDLTAAMRSRNVCTVLLTDCWTGSFAVHRIVELLAENPAWTAVNLEK